jgi:hypothetical protein
VVFEAFDEVTEAANLRNPVAQVQTHKNRQKHGLFWASTSNLRTFRGAKTFCSQPTSQAVPATG